MPSVYRPRASPLWHIVHYAWAEFESGYERFVRPEASDRRLEVP